MTATTTAPTTHDAYNADTHDQPVNAAELERLKKRFLKLDAFVSPSPPLPLSPKALCALCPTDR